MRDENRFRGRIQLRRRLLDPARKPRRDREAIVRVANRILKASRERQAPVPRMRLAKARDRARRCQGRRGKAAKRDFRLPGETIEPCRGGSAPAAVEIRDALRGRVIDEPEGVAADAAHVGIEDGERGRSGERGIHRGTAIAQRVRAGGRGERMWARDHAASCEDRRHQRPRFLPVRLPVDPYRFRARAAPAASASSFQRAISRSIGAMPQLVHGKRCLAGTYLSALPITSQTSCGVSTFSLATSITPRSTSLPFSRRRSSTGTLEWMHSSETWSILLFASAGKISSYWRQDSPRVFFQSRFALMP